MQDDYLYRKMKSVNDKLLAEEPFESCEEHIFSDIFEAKIKAVKKMPNEKNKRIQNHLKLKRIAAVALIITITSMGTGVAVNAATGGQITEWIHSLWYKTDNGATWNFEYSTGNGIDVSDLPEGTIKTVVVYKGNGNYEKKDGENVQMDKLIIVDDNDKPKIGKEYEAFIIP